MVGVLKKEVGGEVDFISADDLIIGSKKRLWMNRLVQFIPPTHVCFKIVSVISFVCLHLNGAHLESSIENICLCFLFFFFLTIKYLDLH